MNTLQQVLKQRMDDFEEKFVVSSQGNIIWDFIENNEHITHLRMKSHNKETVVAILEAVKLSVAIRASRWQDYYGHHITAVALGDVVNELSSTLQDIKKQNNE